MAQVAVRRDTIDTVFLTVPEVAAVIRRSPARTYALLSEGIIPFVRFGRQVVVPRAAFETWLSDMNQRALVGVGTESHL